jgi:hypothetical protein
MITEITEDQSETIGIALTRLVRCIRKCEGFVIEARCRDLSNLVMGTFDGDSVEEITETISHLLSRLRDNNPLTERRRPYLTALVAAIETQIEIATDAQQ